ncbi:MAG: extracellular solute-binding protein [Candidatus Falkowbacteria bacterium]
MNKKIIFLALIFVFMASSGFGCAGGNQAAQQQMTPVTINYWRVTDGEDAFREVIAAYNKVHPNVTIKYRKLRYEEFETELVNALAEDRGPDMFSVNAADLKKYIPKIAPMPDQITLAYPQEQGTLKKEIVPVLRTMKSVSLDNIKNSFLDMVYQDVVFTYNNPQTKKDELRVYGLPLAMDTMATYYNKDLLNNANIGDLTHGEENSRLYWNKQFQKDVKKMTKQGAQGEILQSGVALGGGNNIERSTDVMTLLMMQNGAQIIDNNNGRAVFADFVPGKDYNPGMSAVKFYTDFANPSTDVYTWNAKLDNSLQMFMDGRLAVMFGYSFYIPTIKAQAPKLNYGILPMPQIEGSDTVQNIADYWVETVSKKSKHQDIAWDFIQFMTYQSKIAKLYLDSAHKLTALRSLVEGEQNSDLSVFAKQLLSAKTWYRGYDYPTASKAFRDMAEAIVVNPDQLEHEVKVCQEKVRQTLNVAQ